MAYVAFSVYIISVFGLTGWLVMYTGNFYFLFLLAMLFLARVRD